MVEAVRRIVGFRQIGHLGTLDPLATGVLVLLLGRATRLAQFYVGRRKALRLLPFRFGFATDILHDADGAPLGPDTAPQIDRAEIERLAAARVGPLSAKCRRRIPRRKSTAAPPTNSRARKTGRNFG